MRGYLVSMLACAALGVTMPAMAQSAAGSASATAVTGLSGPDYVKMTADADNYEVQSSRLAASRSRREDVKGFAKQMVVDHSESGKALAAALSNSDRRITPPPTQLSAAAQSKLDLLRKAPRGSFDQLYLQQQLEAHQAALALQQGYADTGTDPALKQVAGTIVPVVQRHLAALQGMMNGM